MGLNTAGINALLDAGRGATLWVAVGSGTTAGSQTSNERGAAALEVAFGVDARSGRAVVVRPFTGSVMRPNAGVVVRP